MKKAQTLALYLSCLLIWQVPSISFGLKDKDPGLRALRDALTGISQAKGLVYEVEVRQDREPPNLQKYVSVWDFGETFRVDCQIVQINAAPFNYCYSYDGEKTYLEDKSASLLKVHKGRPEIPETFFSSYSPLFNYMFLSYVGKKNKAVRFFFKSEIENEAALSGIFRMIKKNGKETVCNELCSIYELADVPSTEREIKIKMQVAVSDTKHVPLAWRELNNKGETMIEYRVLELGSTRHKGKDFFYPKVAQIKYFTWDTQFTMKEPINAGFKIICKKFQLLNLNVGPVEPPDPSLFKGIYDMDTDKYIKVPK